MGEEENARSVRKRDLEELWKRPLVVKHEDLKYRERERYAYNLCSDPDEIGPKLYGAPEVDASMIKQKPADGDDHHANDHEQGGEEKITSLADAPLYPIPRPVWLEQIDKEEGENGGKSHLADQVAFLHKIFRYILTEVHYLCEDNE